MEGLISGGGGGGGGTGGTLITGLTRYVAMLTREN